MFRGNFGKKRGESSPKTRQHSPLIGVIGIGGRTGTMFAKELENSGKVFGIGKKEEVELIRKKKLFLKRDGKEILFEGKVMEDSEFPKGISFDFLFLTVKNPIDEALKYYFSKIKEKNLKPPVLFLSQNGIEAGQKAIFLLREIFKKEVEKISIFRISLFNPVEKKILAEKNLIIYSLPIFLAVSKIFGDFDEKKVLEIFEKGKFKISFIPQKDSKNMEYSKLFLNLIGMASASQGLSIKEGFSKREIFKEEIEALREYKKMVKLKGGRFLNFPSYPVKFFSFLISLPFFLLFPLRNILAKLIEKGRGGKPKDLDEIDYYNGAVVKMAKELGFLVKVNEKIIQRVKK